MTGYTPDEKLRVDQLIKLRRQWLKDQELSPREPVVAPEKLGRIEQFWARFLQPNTLWRQYAFKTYKAGVTASRILVTAWVVHYFVKYHSQKIPYGVVEKKPRLFPGDVILETGEVVPELPVSDSHGHH